MSARLHLENVSLSLPVFSFDSYSLKKRLVRLGTGGRLQREAGHLVVQALTDVSLDLREGDRVGLVGHNGAGKTTLLRVMAGVYRPSVGRVTTEGRLVPLINAGIGISPEATGYENIVLAGLYLGLSRREIEARVDDIAAFSDLGDYLAMPTHSYSAGMLTRLTFAAVTAIDPDVLLMDEVIGAGDASFQEKALARFNALIGRTKLLVLASHSESWIRRACTSAILMSEGRVLDMGPTDKILADYRRLLENA